MGREGPEAAVVDLMLFVNGIPVVAIVGGSDEIDDVKSMGVDELRRLSDQRREGGDDTRTQRVTQTVQITGQPCQELARWLAVKKALFQTKCMREQGTAQTQNHPRPTPRHAEGVRRFDHIRTDHGSVRLMCASEIHTATYATPL